LQKAEKQNTTHAFLSLKKIKRLSSSSSSYHHHHRQRPPSLSLNPPTFSPSAPHISPTAPHSNPKPNLKFKIQICLYHIGIGILPIVFANNKCKQKIVPAPPINRLCAAQERKTIAGLLVVSCYTFSKQKKSPLCYNFYGSSLCSYASISHSSFTSGVLISHSLLLCFFLIRSANPLFAVVTARNLL